MRQLVYATFITNNCASFYLWRKDNLVKHQKVTKYYVHDFSQGIKLYFEQKKFEFWDQIYPKRVSLVKNRKVSITIEFCIFELA